MILIFHRTNYMAYNETPMRGHEMTKLEMFKTAVSGIVGIGTSKIAHQIISNNVTPENAIDKVTIAAGSIVIGQMVAEASKKHTDKTIDDIALNYVKLRNQITHRP